MSTPVPITVANLRLRIKQRADIEKSGSAGVVSDDEILRLINLYLSFLTNKINTLYEKYTSTFCNFQVKPPTQRYPLPVDFYKLQSIGLVDVPGDVYNTWTPLDVWQDVNQNVPGNGFLFFTNGMYTYMNYQIRGMFLEFRPVKSAQLVGMWYTPQSPQLQSDTDTLPAWIIPGWEEYIVARCASMIALKEQRENSQHEALWAEISKQLESFAPNRDSFRPPVVQRAWDGGRNNPWNNYGGGYGPGTNF